MTVALGVFVILAVGALVIGLVAVAGTKMLRDGSGSGSIIADGLGNFIDVFDPARARADRDIESQKHRGEIMPSPDDDDDIALKLDLDAGTAHVRRPPV